MATDWCTYIRVSIGFFAVYPMRTQGYSPPRRQTIVARLVTDSAKSLAIYSYYAMNKSFLVYSCIEGPCQSSANVRPTKHMGSCIRGLNRRLLMFSAWNSTQFSLRLATGCMATYLKMFLLWKYVYWEWAFFPFLPTRLRKESFPMLCYRDRWQPCRVSPRRWKGIY